MNVESWLREIVGLIGAIVGFLFVRVWNLHQRLGEKPDAASIQAMLSPMNRDLRHLAERLDRFDRRRGELIGRAEADKLWERIESADRDRAEDRAAQAALVEQVRGLERRIEEMAPDVKASAQTSAATGAAVNELLKELRRR